MEKRRLGRGLDALIGGSDTAIAEPAAESTGEVPVEKIEHNPFQPRRSFDKDELASLSASVREHGILQPLVVRVVGDHFQLVAGERRLRAAQSAGLATVPIRVVDFNDQQVLEAALAENIHRTDLNPIEKAQGFKDYLDRFGVNHDQLAQRLGLARSSITNLVNLLEMAAEVQEGLRLGQISEAHAKLLKGIKNKEKQVKLFKQIVAMGLSVKATEGLVREQKESAGAAPPAEKEPSEAVPRRTIRNGHIKAPGERYPPACRLATHVEIKIREQGQKGKSSSASRTNDDFMRIMEVLRKR